MSAPGTPESGSRSVETPAKRLERIAVLTESKASPHYRHHSTSKRTARHVEQTFLRRVAGHIKAHFQTLNVVDHNAGMMQTGLLASGELDVAEAAITTNLLGPICLNGVKRW